MTATPRQPPKAAADAKRYRQALEEIHRLIGGPMRVEVVRQRIAVITRTALAGEEPE